jgi:hypothetical protein
MAFHLIGLICVLYWLEKIFIQMETLSVLPRVCPFKKLFKSYLWSNASALWVWSLKQRCNWIFWKSLSSAWLLTHSPFFNLLQVSSTVKGLTMISIHALLFESTESNFSGSKLSYITIRETERHRETLLPYQYAINLPLLMILLSNMCFLLYNHILDW